MSMRKRDQSALVLSGGGARGAYQAGVLRGLADLGALPGGFSILVGSSAGSINAGVLAAHADDFGKGVGQLERVWGQLRPQQVFRTDVRSLGTTGVRWAWDLTLGGAIGRVAPKSLLDTTPLRRLLERRVPFRQIKANVERGLLDAIAVAATDLHTTEGVIFLHAAGGTPLWRRRRWRVEPTELRVDHLMASSAIPVFFPSVEVEGRYFGDGCIRNTTPLSPAINLGAERIIAVGVRGPRRNGRLRSSPSGPPSLAEIAGVLLDAVMLDSIEVDVEHSERVNDSVLTCRTTDRANPFREIDVLWLRPSVSLSAIAAEMEDRIPAVVRYLMRGLGSDEAIIELASYLLFDAKFCGRLIEIGRADVEASRDEIEAFLSGKPRRGENAGRRAAS
jgi:NTE family protein